MFEVGSSSRSQAKNRELLAGTYLSWYLMIRPMGNAAATKSEIQDQDRALPILFSPFKAFQSVIGSLRINLMK